jgi:hypothetical protein
MKRIESLLNIDAQQLTEDYKNLGSLREIAKKYKTSHNAVAGMFTRFGIVYRSRNWKRTDVNDCFFDMDMLDERSAYWAGFIAADGCVYKKTLRISLSEEDLSHLIKFKDNIQYAGNILKSVNKLSRHNKKWKNVNMVTISITSAQIVEALLCLGITERKTKTLEFPNLPDHLIKHFCRGYFDGDGSWSFWKPRTRPNHSKQLMFCLRGTEKFLNVFNENLVRGCGLDQNKLRKKTDGDGKTHVLAYTGNIICERIAKWMYDGSSTYLVRKFEKALGHTHIGLLI